MTMNERLAAARAEDEKGAPNRTVVQVRLTKEEKARLAANAAEAGRTVSGYVRARAVYVGCDEPRADGGLLRDILWEMRREGSTANQLAKIAHSHGLSEFDTDAANKALARLSYAAGRVQDALADVERPDRRSR